MLCFTSHTDLPRACPVGPDQLHAHVAQVPPAVPLADESPALEPRPRARRVPQARQYDRARVRCAPHRRRLPGAFFAPAPLTLVSRADPASLARRSPAAPRPRRSRRTGLSAGASATTASRSSESRLRFLAGVAPGLTLTVFRSLVSRAQALKKIDMLHKKALLCTPYSPGSGASPVLALRSATRSRLTGTAPPAGSKGGSGAFAHRI